MCQRKIARRITVEAVLLLVLGVAVLMPWGCGKSPLSPENTSHTFELPDGVVAHPGILLGETEPADPGLLQPAGEEIFNPATSKALGTFEKEVDTTGDVIEMDIEGEISYFEVPAKALADKTNITVDVTRITSAALRRITQFDFRPEGLVFEIPASLAYRSIERDGTKLVIYWYDPLKEIWLESAEAVVVEGYATFPIRHFSRYRTTERISLGGQQ